MTDKEKKLRQHKKELKSFRNKMGKHIVWFDALTSEKQYDLLFLWKKEKHLKRDIVEPTKTKGKYIKRTYVAYPASLKHFLKVYTLDRRFQPNKARIREASLKLLLNELS